MYKILHIVFYLLQKRLLFLCLPKKFSKIAQNRLTKHRS